MSVTLQNRQRRLRINARLLTALAHRAAALSGTPQTEVNIVLVRDRAMAKLNAAYHATAGPTDVLSFDYGATGELIISTDHGRGETFGDWITHGKDIPGAEFVWMAVLGPKTPALGVRENVDVTTSQIAATIAKLVGEDFREAVPQAAEPLPGVVAE